MSDKEKPLTHLEQLAKAGAPDNPMRQSLLRNHVRASDTGHAKIKKMPGYETHRGVGLSIDKIKDNLAEYLEGYHDGFHGITEKKAGSHNKLLWRGRKLDEAINNIIRSSGNQYRNEEDLYNAIQEEGLEVFTTAHNSIERFQDKVSLDKQLAVKILGENPEDHKKFAKAYQLHKGLPDERLNEIILNAHTYGARHINESGDNLRNLHETYK